ncbi:MAG: GTP 3',8-cyclase MoaA [Acidimicrobiales bacterium]
MVPRPLVDGYGRVVRDLRISITDRCNFRCTYCMPAEGLEWVARDDLLTYEEITRVAHVCVERFGFEALRLTGGEPTVRAGLARLVAMLAPLGTDLSMTTNGATLGLVAGELRAAGLGRVNISLDSLQPDRFAALARRDALDRVLDGIDAALAAGFHPVKVNVVMVRGVNEDEAVDFATFGRERGVEPRFIEFMPLDADRAWAATQVVPAAETVAAITAVYPAEPAGRAGPEPATRWRYLDGRGAFGVVPSVTQPFCGTCDRVRLTAEGQFRNCLFALGETDLRSLLRSGATDDALAGAIAGDVAGKWAGHAIGRVNFVRPRRTMSQIGG